MKKLNCIIFFSLLLFRFYHLLAIEELEVSLQTKKPLMPIYISKIFNEKSAFDDKYLKNLKSILEFDFEYNGFTENIKHSSEKDFKLSHFDDEIAFNQDFWKKQKVAFLLKTKACDNFLSFYIYNVENNFLKKISHIKIVGNLNKDRQTLHRISDEIQEMLFGQQGIFSSKILYTIRTKDSSSKYKSEIFMCDMDGENNKQLSFENSYLVHPIFIPNNNSNEFLYVSYQSGQSKLFKTSFSKNAPSKFINLKGNQLLPAISLKGDKVAFISDAAGRADLFYQHIDSNNLTLGKPIQLYSFPLATNASPSFSPDGKKLAFVSDKDGSCKIYVIKLPEDDFLRKRPVPHLITKKNRQNVTPSWSKDGKKIAFSAKNNNIRQIWIYDFEMDEEYQLTTTPINKENPFFANDSLHIVYNTENNVESELYLINIKQKKPIKISKGEGRKRFPCLEP